MKNVKSVLKCLLVGMVVAVGCLVSGIGVKADINDSNVSNHYTMQNGDMKTIYKDNSFVINSDVTVKEKDCINNTVSFDKDGQLYSFYVDDANNYYIDEKINVTMNDKNEVVDCIVDNEPVVYKNVSIIDSNHDEYVYVSIDGNKYSFYNEDGINNGWNIGDKVNVVMQNDKILAVRPCVS